MRRLLGQRTSIDLAWAMIARHRASKVMLSREGGVLNCRPIALVALYASIASLMVFRSRLGSTSSRPKGREASIRGWRNPWLIDSRPTGRSTCRATWADLDLQDRLREYGVRIHVPRSYTGYQP